MIKLLIKKIDGYNYYLNDVNSGDSYVINIEFYGDKPAVNDYLYLSYPLTKEKIKIPAKVAPTFKAGNKLKDALN